MLSAAQTFLRPALRALLKNCALLAACLLLTAFSAAAARVFTVPFSYYADHQELSAVLTNFARTQGLGASVTPRVKGTVSGRFQDVDPMTFLSGMESAFNASWYQLGNTLHFYDTSETQKAVLVPRSGSAGQLLNALKGSGVISPQLPPRLSPAGDMVTIQGPPDYLDQIRAAAAAFENAQAKQLSMRVFPLKHAWAEDMTVSSMNQNITVPGIASILRAMVTGSQVSPAKVTQERAAVEKLGGKGRASIGREGEGQNLTAPSTPSAAAGGASIMADPRMNAVIVSDASYRMPFYEQVIRDLDKPVELVEIHAAIVDIDTELKRELGISLQGANNRAKGWSTGGTSSGRDFSGSGMPAYAGAASDAGMTLSTIYTHGTDFFLSRIQALEENDEARVLGRPSVLTVDNIQATLENTTTYYVEVQGYQAVDLYKVEAGTVLRVTPHIIREHGKTAIKLAVSVQDDQDTINSTNTTTSAGVPPIKQTKINTQAVVGSGQSLLIGGYYYEQKAKGESGIPLLKDIPVLGHLFKTSAKKSKRMERLILITPRIVGLNENNVPAQTDDAAMHRTAGQADYEPRIPVRPVKKPGCASSRPTPERAASISTRE